MTDHTAIAAGVALVGELKVQLDFVDADGYVTITEQKLETIIAALTAAGEMDWQPIETAPKDGMPILILEGETIPDTPNIRVASYVGGPDAHRLGYKAYLNCGGWLIWNDDADFYVTGAQYPTHWQPLPPPPGKENE